MMSYDELQIHMDMKDAWENLGKICISRYKCTPAENGPETPEPPMDEAVAPFLRLPVILFVVLTILSRAVRSVR